ncbi:MULTISPECIES: DUF4432 family protein [Microbacterium]|uniref:DUF4432 family protein n=1 Tax=Microbacterium TaxID=33882 RepID=UPI00146ED78E|nr:MULTISPECIES: DUF4432 family protein [Microbacterium]
MSRIPARLKLGEEGTLTAELLPRAGMGVGAVRFANRLVSWQRSAYSTASSSHADPWLNAFSGGLITTCGLRNVGAPSEGHGLHGRFALTPTETARVDRPASDVWSVSAELNDDMLHCSRTVVVDCARGFVEILDAVRNDGVLPEPAPLLYHVNFGGDLLGISTCVRLQSRGYEARDTASNLECGHWSAPSSVGASHEVVLEHQSVDGEEGVTVMNYEAGIRAHVQWTGLHRLHQWIDFQPGWGVMAIEPANCSLLGRRVDRESGRLPTLAPREVRWTSVRVTMEVI